MKLDIDALLSNVTSAQRTKTNRAFVGIFLIICVITLLLKIIDGVMLDLGYRDGEINPGFWESQNIGAWIPNNVEITSTAYLSAVKTVAHHPNTIWFLTQFTWLTTILLTIFLIVRFFQIGTVLPKWLKWLASQRTLTLITIYDLVVGIVFWAAIFRYFDRSFTPSMRGFEVLITVLVHAVLPLIITTYALIFLLRDKEAAILKEWFVLKSMIYPIAYMFFYLLLTIVWDDPYGATNMHDKLVSEGWKAWASELWKMPLGVVGIYILIGILTTTHNLVLIKYNRYYKPYEDSEMIAARERKIVKTQLQAQRDFKRYVETLKSAPSTQDKTD